MPSSAELQLVVTVLNNAQKQLSQIEKQLVGVGRASGRAGAGADAFNRANTRLLAGIGILNPSMATATSQIEALTNISGKATIALGALAAGGIALGAVLVLSGKSAIDFETSFRGIRKTVEGTEEEFAFLEETNRRLAISLGTSVNKINAVGRAAGALGIPVADIGRFEEIIVKFATAADNISVDEAATSFGGLRAILGLSVDEIANLTSVIVDLGNKFVTTEAQITGFLTGISGIGAVLHISATDLAGISAALGNVQADIEAGGSATNRVLLALNDAVVSGGDELKVFAAVLRTTPEAFKELVRADPTEAFVRFVEGLSASGEDAQRVLAALGLADIRVTREFLKLAASGGEVRRAIEEARLESERGTAANIEFGKQMSTTAKRADVMKSKLNEAAITLGQGLSPAINLGITGLSHFADALRVGVVGIVEAGEAVGNFSGAVFRAVFNLGGVTEAWKNLFLGLPGPVQSAVISIAGLFDALANAIIASLNKAASGVDAFFKAITFGKFSIFGGRQIGAVDTQGALQGLLPPRTGQGPTGLSFEEILRIPGPAGALLRQQLAQLAAASGGGATGGGSIPGLDALLDSLLDPAAKATKAIDILADGIITLDEALAAGLSDSQVVALELQRTLEDLAREEFRATIETGKLGIILGARGLTGQAGILQHAMRDLGEGFRKAGESITGFLDRLANAALKATQTAFDALFNRPTRETAGIQLQVTRLQRQRLLLEQGGATDAQLKAIDDQIVALQRNIELTENKNKILELEAALADKTLLTDQQLNSQAVLLIGVISQESALVGSLNTQLAYEILARAGATTALGEFTAAVQAAQSVLGLGGSGGVQVNVSLSPQLSDLGNQVLRTVNRETEKALARVGFGGTRAMSGALRP